MCLIKKVVGYLQQGSYCFKYISSERLLFQNPSLKSSMQNAKSFPIGCLESLQGLKPIHSHQKNNSRLRVRQA